MLNIFFYYILVLLLLEIVVAVLAYFYESELAVQLNTAWTSFGKGLDAYNVGILSTIQKDYFCCGGAGYADWIDIFQAEDITLTTPYGENFDLEDPKNSDTPFPPTCCLQVEGASQACNSDVTLLWENGCVATFLSAITDNLLTVGIVCSVVAGLQLIAIVASYLLTRAMKKAQGKR